MCRKMVGHDRLATPHIEEIPIVPAITNDDPDREDFQPHLNRFARARLTSKWRAKVDPSEIVQQNLPAGLYQLQQRRRSGKVEMAVWMRRMLSYNIADTLGTLGARKPDVALECSLEAPPNDVDSRLEACPKDVQIYPIKRACGNERAIRLAGAINRRKWRRESLEVAD